MSRTYAHVPYRVLVYREGIAYHDHSRGECDLVSKDKSGLHSPGGVSARFRHYRRCAKMRYYRVVCEHIYRVEDGLDGYVFHHVMPRPHSVVSMTSYHSGESVQPFWAFPQVLEECTRAVVNRGYGRSGAVAPYDIVPMHVINEYRCSHEYVFIVEDLSIPCVCDSWYPNVPLERCTWDLPKRKRASVYRCTCSWCDRGLRAERKYGNRGRVNQELKNIARAWNSGDEVD